MIDSEPLVKGDCCADEGLNGNGLAAEAVAASLLTGKLVCKVKAIFKF